VTECNDKYFKKIEDQISQYENSILIFGGYLQEYLLDSVDHFIPNGKYNTLKNSFKNEILKFSKKNKVILVYPIPEFTQNPNQSILNQWVKQGFPNKFNIRNITVSNEFYDKRTKSSFDLLDSVQNDNVYRVYPHRLFCDTNFKNKCTAHDNKHIFYEDSNHPSPKGAEMINDLIIKQIEKIELKSN
jgi:hypothetical protein